MNDNKQSNRFYYSNRNDINRVCREVAFRFRRSLKYERSLTVDDLYQEALMRVLINSSYYDASKGEVSNYIHNLAYNAAVDALRRYGNYKEDSKMEEPTENITPRMAKKKPSVLSVDNDAFRGESRVLELMECLSNDRKATVELKFGINCYCEHADEDIARELGISRPTVKKEINLALEQMRQYAKQLDWPIAA